jgi:hypothetical protein
LQPPPASLEIKAPQYSARQGTPEMHASKVTHKMAIKIPQFSYDFMRDVVANIGFYIVFIVQYSMLPRPIPTCNRKMQIFLHLRSAVRES